VSDTTVASVAVGLWLHQRFDYAIPPSMRGVLLPGMRVLVPFGPRRVTGYVVAVKGESDFKGKLRDVVELLDESPAFNEELLGLLQWAAEYYLVPLGELLRKSLPPSMHQADVRHVVVTELGREQAGGNKLLELLCARESVPFRTALNFATQGAIDALERQGLVATQRVLAAAQARPRMETFVDLCADISVGAIRGRVQRGIVEVLAEAGRPVAVTELRQRFPGLSGPLKALVEAGYVKTHEERSFRTLDSGYSVVDEDHTLNSEQEAAVEEIGVALGSGRYSPFLLHGVTGSGKTEVYMRLVELALARGLSTLVLVPEIALTPQLMARFEARFERRIAILHSALTPGERLDYWYQVASGSLPIVLGARSAIFAPVPNLGLIVVDEEHEGSFKQDVSPFYNARDLALTRASRLKCAVVLGSATPSLESWHNCKTGKIRLVTMRNRATARPLPDVALVDLRTQPFADSERLFSRQLADGIRETLARGEQTILFLNRKGFSQFMLCPRCGYVPSCDHCSVSLTYYKGARVLRCHYCQQEASAAQSCPVCGEESLKLVGAGTERVSETLAELFPSARFAQVDAASGARTNVPRILDQFRKGELDILVGTQMIAKGHDFPNVTLVGVLRADQGLSFPDVRAAERTFQLVTQVAGRAGRGSQPGRVVLQTFMPTHYSLVYAQRQDFVRFAEEELGVRQMRQLPPFSVFALFRFSGPDLVRLREAADVARGIMDGALRGLAGGGAVDFLGPGPAPIALVADRHRFQLLVKAPSRVVMQTLLRKAFNVLEGELRRHSSVQWSVDVDPLSVM